MSDTKWCDHPETKVRGYYLEEPYDNVFIGCDPNDGMRIDAANRIDAFVNVSDSPCNHFEPSRPGQFMHWYPVNEAGRWNLGYLFWLKKVLDFHHEKKHQIYLHCHAGAYRSPSAALLWLQSRGISPEEALRIVKESSSLIYKIWENHGNIPALKDKVFESMRKHPNYSLAGTLFEASDNDYWNHEIASGHLRKSGLLHRYFFFYYKPKWWMRDKIEWVKYWAKGYGWIRTGIAGTTYYKRARFWSWPVGAKKKDEAE